MSWDLDSIPKYVINLDRRKDRWTQFQNGSGFKDLTHLRRWSAVDGKLINIDTDNNISLFTKYNIVRGIRRSHMELNTKGGVGCYYSHVDVWKHFLKTSQSEVALVFEDDIIVDAKSVLRIRKFIENSPVVKNSDMWDFCILGPYSGNKKHEAIHPDDPTCMRLMEFNGMTGYLINKKGIRKVLPIIYPIQGHIDWFLSICAQLQYLELCAPRYSLLNVQLSRTDIQKTSTCEICDIASDFEKESEIISRWRLRTLQIEELMLIVLGIYFVKSVMVK